MSRLMPRLVTCRRLALAALCCSALSACIVTPIGRPYSYGPGGEAIIADVAPPAPYYEPTPPLPFAGAVWIGGYWGYHGGRHNWVGGHYEQPRPGYGWEPHRWVQHDNRWHLEGGRWQRR